MGDRCMGGWAKSWHHLKKEMRKELYYWIEMAVFALVVLTFIFVFLGRTFSVYGSSMEPTLYPGDHIVVASLYAGPKQGDVIVCGQPQFEGGQIVKRVIACAGDTIDIDIEKHAVIVNGVVLNELYIYSATSELYDFQGPVTVPEGKLFVLGDNRNHSWDSRSAKIGMIDERNVVGKVLFRIYPLWEWTVK